MQAADIEAAYHRLGYQIGWRFMMCPRANLHSSELVVVTLNPGGQDQHGPALSYEAGNAYCQERWGDICPGKAKLQLQMQAMYRLLGVGCDEVFSANYVPFRSPSWQKLLRREEATRFADSLWGWLRPQLNFTRAVCIGKELPGRPIAKLFGATLETSLNVGWGRIKADRYRLPDGRALVALPHLSRFPLFNRLSSVGPLNEIFDL